MSLLGAKPDWKNQCITFHSSETTIPAVHRAESSTTGLSVSSTGVTSVSVASVHADFEAIPVGLKSRFYLPAGTEASVVAFTDTKPLADTHVVLKPRMVSQSEFSEGIGTIFFLPNLRKCCCTYNSNMACGRWSVWLQIANPSTRGVTIPAHLIHLNFG